MDDDEQLLEEFGELDVSTPSRSVEAGTSTPLSISPADYAVLVNRLLDEMSLAGMRSSAQRIYLQLIRESLGRGSHQVRIGVGQLVKRTRLTKMTVIRTLAAFQKQELIQVLEGATRSSPTLYKVNILASQMSASHVEQEHPSTAEMASRLDQLRNDDRKDLEAMWGHLSAEERQKLIDEIYEEQARFESRVGTCAVLTPGVLEKAIRYRFLLKRFGPARLRQAYPRWFPFI
jgi:hypothetical protein